jgi:hypothetical protein
MREDIQRLSAVMMAIYQERQHQLALYAALLEVEGSAAIAAEPSVISPRARTQGQPPRSVAATRPGGTPPVPALDAQPAAPTAAAPPAAPTTPVPQPTATAPQPEPLPVTVPAAPSAPAPAGGAPAPGRLSGPVGPDTGMMDLPMTIAP